VYIEIHQKVSEKAQKSKLRQHYFLELWLQGVTYSNLGTFFDGTLKTHLCLNIFWFFRDKTEAFQDISAIDGCTFQI
jgi:hypothetical protein